MSAGVHGEGVEGADLIEALSRRAETSAGQARAELYHQAGLAAELRLGDLGRAVGCYTRALEADPEHRAAREALIGLLDDPAFEGLGIEGVGLARRAGEEGAPDALCVRAERRLAAHDIVGAAEDLGEALRLAPDHRQSLLVTQELHALSEVRAEMVEGAERSARQLAGVTLDESLQAACSALSARLAALTAAEPAERGSESAARVLAEALSRSPGDLGLRWASQRALGESESGEALTASLVEEAEGEEAPDLKMAAAIDAAARLCWRAGDAAPSARAERALDLLRRSMPTEQAGLPRLDLSVGLELAAMFARAHDPEVELSLLRELGQRLDSAGRQAAIFTRIGQLTLEQNVDVDGIEGEKALRYFEAAVEAEPTYRAALALLEELHEDGAFPQKARDMLRQRAEQSGRADLMVGAARVTLDRLGRRDEAIVLLRQAIAMSDEADLLGPASILDAAVEFVAGSESPAADRHQLMEEALARVDSGLGRRLLLRRMVDAAIEDGEEGVAIGALSRLVALAPGDLFQIERLADLYARRGAWTELGELRRLELEWTEPQDPELASDVMYALGRLCQVALGDEEAALGWFRAMLARQPDDLSALAGAGRILVRHHRWRELAEIYERELEHATAPASRASMAFRLATLYERVLGDPIRARDYYEQVRRTNVNHLPSLFGLVRVAERLGDWSLWVELIAEWSQRERDDVLAGTLSCELAYALEVHLGDQVEAYDAYRRALDRLPKLELARLGMIRCLYRLGRHEEAAQVALERLDPAAGPEEGLDTLLSAQLLTPDERAGAERTLEAFPDHAPTLLTATRAALALGDLPRASARAEALGRVMPEGSIREGTLRLAGLLDRLSGEVPSGEEHPTFSGQAMDELSLLRMEARYRAAGDLEQLGAIMERRAEQAVEPTVQAAYLTASGRALQARGQFEAALGTYNNALALSEDFVPAAKSLKLLYEMLGNREGLATASEIEGRISRDPVQARANFLLAGDLRRRQLGDIVGAVQDLENVLRIDPTERTAFESLREIYSVQNDAHRLFGLLERRAESINDPKEQISLLLIMAQVAFNRLKNRELTIQCHQRVVAIDPGHIQSLRILAEIHQSEGRWREAIGALQRVVSATDDKSLLAMIQRSIAELHDIRLDDPVGAIEAYIGVITSDPDHVPSLRRLGELLCTQGRWEDAARTYGRLLQLERRRTKLIGDLKALAVICIRGLEDPQRAEQCLAQALKLNNQDIEIHRLLVEHYEGLGQAAQLAAHLEQAARQFSAALAAGDLRNAEALFGLTQIAAWQRRPDRAFVLAVIAESLGMLKASALALAMRSDGGSVSAVTSTSLDAVDVRAAADLLAAEACRETLSIARAQSQDRLPLNPIPVDMTGAALPAELSMPLLQIMRYGQGAIGRLFAPNLRELGINRRTRLSDRTSHPGERVLLNWPRLYSLRDVVVHVVPAAPERPTLAIHDQPMLILSPDAVDKAAAGDPRLLFDLGLTLAPLSMGIGAFVDLPPQALLAAVTALVRLSVPGFLANDPRANDPRVDEERLSRLLVKRPDNQLVAQSLDVSGKIDAAGILNQRALLQRAFERLALIPIFDPAAALVRVRSSGGDVAGDDIIRFMLSERYAEMRRALGLAAKL